MRFPRRRGGRHLRLRLTASSAPADVFWCGCDVQFCSEDEALQLPEAKCISLRQSLEGADMAFAAKALELQLADSQKACLSVAQKSSSLRPCFERPWLSFARRMKPSARNMARRRRTHRDSSSDREDLQQAGAGCWTLRLVNASLQVPHASGACNTFPPFSLATLADEPAYSLGRCLCLLPGSAASGPCREVILSAAQNFHVSVWYLYYS